MTADKLLKCVAASCKHYGGKEDVDYYRPHFIVPTRHGPLSVTPFHDDKRPWIALKFTEHSTGKVYDTLCGGEFNGISGKWNVHAPGNPKNEKGRRLLREYCLTELCRRLEAVKTTDCKPKRLSIQ